ncbi:hypothetical protein F2P56_020345, partial [Juglans regia]
SLLTPSTDQPSLSHLLLERDPRSHGVEHISRLLFANTTFYLRYATQSSRFSDVFCSFWLRLVNWFLNSLSWKKFHFRVSMCITRNFVVSCNGCFNWDKLRPNSEQSTFARERGTSCQNHRCH